LKAEHTADQKDHADGHHHDTANKGQHNGQIRIAARQHNAERLNHHGDKQGKNQPGPHAVHPTMEIQLSFIE
jgi:hypothetical protein